MDPVTGARKADAAVKAPVGRHSDFGEAPTDPVGRHTDFGEAPTDPVGRHTDFGEAPTDPVGRHSDFGEAPTDPALKPHAAEFPSGDANVGHTATSSAGSDAESVVNTALPPADAAPDLRGAPSIDKDAMPKGDSSATAGGDGAVERPEAKPGRVEDIHEVKPSGVEIN